MPTYRFTVWFKGATEIEVEGDDEEDAYGALCDEAVNHVDRVTSETGWDWEVIETDCLDCTDEEDEEA